MTQWFQSLENRPKKDAKSKKKKKKKQRKHFLLFGKRESDFVPLKFGPQFEQ